MLPHLVQFCLFFSESSCFEVWFFDHLFLCFQQVLMKALQINWILQIASPNCETEMILIENTNYQNCVWNIVYPSHGLKFLNSLTNSPLEIYLEQLLRRNTGLLIPVGSSLSPLKNTITVVVVVVVEVVLVSGVFGQMCCGVWSVLTL